MNFNQPEEFTNSSINSESESVKGRIQSLWVENLLSGLFGFIKQEEVFNRHFKKFSHFKGRG